LRRGQTDARRVVHRLEHVVDQLLKQRIGDLARVTRFATRRNVDDRPLRLL